MQNDKKGTLTMLDHNIRELPSPAQRRAEPQPAGSNLKPKADPDQGRKGHKKHKQAKRRAEVKAALAPIAEALAQLRGRVSDLHGLHLEGEGRGARLVARLEALGAEQARTQALTGALNGRVEALRARVEGMRAEAAVIGDTLADLAMQPDRDSALFALEDRIQEAEETLAGLLAQADAGAAAQGLTEGLADRLADQLGGRLDGVAQDLTAQAGRLAEIEARATGPAADAQALTRVEQTLETLAAGLDQRIGAQERDINTLRDQNKRWREAERTWAEERLQGLRRGLAGGMGALALLLLAGVAATWWHGERQLDLIAARINAVEQGTGERLAALAAQTSSQTSSQAEPIDARVDAALGRLGAVIQGLQATNADLSARVAALAAAGTGAGDASRADLLARVRALEEVRALTAPVAQPSAPVLPASPAAPVPVQAPEPVAAVAPPAAPMPAEVPPAAIPPAAVPQPAVPQLAVPQPAAPQQAVPQQAVPPAGERFALQLIGFRSQASLAPFARAHGIESQTRWLRAPGRGRAWYLVLFGDYGTRGEAQAALDALPADLRRLSPQVRPLAPEAEPLAAD